MRPQRGAALLLLLLVVGVLGAFLAMRAVGDAGQERERRTTAALAQAKDALLGYAATYRDKNGPREMFGYLPCPDMGRAALAPGQADPLDTACAGRDVTVIGRLPWNTLGLEPLHAAAGDCLWYTVSGHAKANLNKTRVFNWDSLGQFSVQDAQGTPLHGASPHDRPWAVVLAPGATREGEIRSDSNSTCSGSSRTAAYLDGGDVDPIYAAVNRWAPAADALTTLVLSTRASALAGTNNDAGLWITGDEVFRRVKMRKDFKADIDGLVGDLANHLNGLDPARLPAASTGNKGVDELVKGFLLAQPTLSAARKNLLTNWQDNLLYTRTTPASSVNGVGGCLAVLLFGGERAQRSVAPLGPQLRSTPAQKGSAAQFGDPAMYLEGVNTVFPASAAYQGAAHFNAISASADLVRCIKGLPAGAVQVSFAQDLVAFNAIGPGVQINPDAPGVDFAPATGTSSACLWFPQGIALQAKTLRVYYEFQFWVPDAYALNGVGVDHGNGFALQLANAQPGAPPDGCGTSAALGVLGGADPWGQHSIVVETDVHRDLSPIHDPVENHSAILLNGQVDHAQPQDSMSLACDGSAAGCRHTPANTFEEAGPALHRQRMEIHTGCAAGCDTCDATQSSNATAPMRVTVWVDCQECDDVSADLDRTSHRPSMQRCVASDAALRSVYFGFTSGFRSGAARQGVSLSNFVLRSE